MTKQEQDDITHCNGCNCMTKSIRKGRAHYVCGKCGYNKTLGDVYQYELENQLEGEKSK